MRTVWHHSRHLSAPLWASTSYITVRTVAGEPYERIVDYELGAMPEPAAAEVLRTYEEEAEDIPF